MDYSIFYWMFGVAIALFIINQLIESRKTVPLKKKSILDKKERKFYKKLKEIADKNELIVYPKANLSSVLKVRKNNENQADFERNLKRLKETTVDFLLLDKKHWDPVLIIELGKNANINDLLNETSFSIMVHKQETNFPVLVIPKINIDENELEKKIRDSL